MYMCVRGVHLFFSFHDFLVGSQNSSYSVILFVFHFNFSPFNMIISNLKNSFSSGVSILTSSAECARHVAQIRQTESFVFQPSKICYLEHARTHAPTHSTLSVCLIRGAGYNNPSGKQYSLSVLSMLEVRVILYIRCVFLDIVLSFTFFK